MDEIKSAKLEKLLPVLALAGAALSLIFTFLIGVSVTGSQSATYYIYHYFDGDFVKSFTLLEGVQRSAMRTAILLGLIFSVIGLLAVAVFAGITVYSAIRKYVLKKDGKIEMYSICTFLAYTLFAGLFYALNYVDAIYDGAEIHTTYNAATVVGLVLSTLVMCAYAVIKTLLQKQYLNDKINLTAFLFNAGRIALLVITIALLTAPAVFVKEAVKAVSEAATAEANAEFTFGFVQLLVFGSASTTTDKLSSLVSSAASGFVVLSLVAVLYTVLTARLLFSLFGKKQNDNVFFIVGFAACFIIMFFAAVAGSFFTDLKDLVSVAGNLEVTEESRTINVAIPIVVFGLALISFIASAIYSSVVGKVAREEEKKLTVQEHKAEGETLLEVDNLCKHFVIGRDFFGRPTKTLKAVDNVTFKLEKGKTLGIVGESGCGKTTMGRTVLRLYDVTSGEVWFKGQKVSSLSNRDFDKLRPNMQMIFQDPYASLSPRLTVGEIIGEAVKQHKLVSKSEYHDYVLSVMKMCGLQPHYFERYPHEFSGGQRQRICIARALALKPDLVICDEPVSALDVSIQAQIINMLIELRKSLGLTYVFISHDLSVIKHISDEVGVMYLGSMVEYGSKDAIFENTLHPYTRALFSAVPVPDPHVKMNRIILKGDIPSPVNPPSGCKFHTRCESCMDICGRIAPAYKEVEKGHFCACHLYNTEEETALLEKRYEKDQKLLKQSEADNAKKGFWSKFKSSKSKAEITEADDVQEG